MIIEIENHVLGNMKLHHVLSIQLSLILFLHLSIPPHTLYNQPLAPAHWGVGIPPPDMSKLSQSRFPHLVCHIGNSHLLPDNLILYLVTPSMPTLPSKHPHLCNMYLANTPPYIKDG